MLASRKETGQDRLAGKLEELRCNHLANEIAFGTNKSLGEGNKRHIEEQATAAATELDAAHIAVEFESNQERVAARNENRCSAAAREKLLQAIKSPPILKTIPKPKRKKNHLVTIEIDLQQKLRATKCNKQQKRNQVLLEITEYKRNFKPINSFGVKSVYIRTFSYQ